MATWGVHSFDNDDAVQWAAAYCDMGLPVAKSTLEIALSDHSNNGLTVDLACRALAACEAVAFALGRGSPESQRLLAAGPVADIAAAEALVSECTAMVAAIADGSVLKDFWVGAGTEDHKKWDASLADLRARITGGQSAAHPGASQAASESSGSGDPSIHTQLESIQAAVAALSTELEIVRLENEELFLRLAKQIEGRGQ